MGTASYYHVCADGADARNFIICTEDYRAAFNLVGACAANSHAVVVAFSLEDTHPHFLLYGNLSDCSEFRDRFEGSYKRYLASSRGTLDNVVLMCQIIHVKSEEHLMNTGTYIINQATKDGKKVMPYDYLWSSGPLYFRQKYIVPIWRVRNGVLMAVSKAGDLSARARQRLFHSKMDVPGDWLICDGLILPSNYVDVKRFEGIYKTCNCFRTFLSSGRAKDDVVIMAMADARGVTMEDSEIRKPCGDLAKSLFGIRDVRRLAVDQRMRLALELRKRFRLSRRQIALLVRLPYSEIEKYLG